MDDDSMDDDSMDDGSLHGKFMITQERFSMLHKSKTYLMSKNDTV